MNTDSHGCRALGKHATDLKSADQWHSHLRLSVDIRVNPWLAIQNCPWLPSATEGDSFLATDEHGFTRMQSSWETRHRFEISGSVANPMRLIRENPCQSVACDSKLSVACLRPRMGTLFLATDEHGFTRMEHSWETSHRFSSPNLSGQPLATNP